MLSCSVDVQIIKRPQIVSSTERQEVSYILCKILFFLHHYHRRRHCRHFFLSLKNKNRCHEYFLHQCHDQIRKSRKDNICPNSARNEILFAKESVLAGWLLKLFPLFVFLLIKKKKKKKIPQMSSSREMDMNYAFIM